MSELGSDVTEMIWSKFSFIDEAESHNAWYKRKVVRKNHWVELQWLFQQSCYTM